MYYSYNMVTAGLNNNELNFVFINIKYKHLLLHLVKIATYL